METLKLNSALVKEKIDRMGINYKQLADLITIKTGKKTSRQIVRYWIKSGSLKGAVPIAAAFDVKPRGLVI